MANLIRRITQKARKAVLPALAALVMVGCAPANLSLEELDKREPFLQGEHEGSQYSFFREGFAAGKITRVKKQDGTSLVYTD